MHFARVSSLVVFAFAITACSSSSTGSKAGPVVDDYNVPDTVSVSTVQTTTGPQQAYLLSGNLDFHDDTENVASFTAHIVPPPANFADTTVPIPTPPGPIAKGPVQAEIALPASEFQTGQVINYQVSVTSVSGIISAPLSKTVTLQ